METAIVSSFINWIISEIGIELFIGAIFGSTIIAYNLYIIVMRLKMKRDNDKIEWYHYLYGVPIVVIGFILDILYNAVFGTILFQELPREWLLTSRLDRHARTGKGWRRKFAKWVCIKLLNPHDDDHCYTD